MTLLELDYIYHVSADFESNLINLHNYLFAKQYTFTAYL